MAVYINARFLTQPITGVQRFAIEICKLLKCKRQDDIHFVAPYNIIHNDIARELNVIVVGKRTGHLWEQIDLPKYLRKNGSPLLLNLCNTAPVLYRNKISTIHDVGFEVFPQTYSKVFLIFYKFLIPKIIKSSKKIVTVSKFSKDEIVKNYRANASIIEIVFNAAGQEFSPQPNTKLKEQNYFLAVSSLNYRKNLPLVLNAFEELIQKDNKYKLFIVGGMDNKSFNALDLDRFKNIEGIEFKGRVSDKELVEYYSNAIAFIYPSLYEGFGIPPLESQYCGCPAIVSNVSCFPEIFGNTVLYCDPNNTNSLVEQMKSILEVNKRKEIVDLGFSNKDKYNWSDSCNKLYQIIKDIK